MTQKIPVGPLGSSEILLANTRPAVIDGDSFAYIIGYNHKDNDEVDRVIENVDEFIHSILQATQSSLYVGILNPKEEAGVKVKNFRTVVARTKPYKGNRPEKPEWYQKWAPIIEDRLITEWGFTRAPYNVEADDVAATLMDRLNSIKSCNPICCGCDKDLKQIPGHHYNYKKNVLEHVTVEQGLYSLFSQVLTGDSTDNIAGLPGCGEKGTAAILSAEGVDPENYHLAVLHAYTNKLGLDNGVRNFYENYMLCKLRAGLDNVDHFELTHYNLEANAVREFTRTEEVEEVDMSQFQANEGDEVLFTAD